MKKRQFNIKLPDHLIRAVKMKAFENYRDTSREVEIALRNHLDRSGLVNRRRGIAAR